FAPASLGSAGSPGSAGSAGSPGSAGSAGSPGSAGSGSNTLVTVALVPSAGTTSAAEVPSVVSWPPGVPTVIVVASAAPACVSVSVQSAPGGKFSYTVVSSSGACSCRTGPPGTVTSRCSLPVS